MHVLAYCCYADEGVGLILKRPNKNLLEDVKVYFKTKKELDKYSTKENLLHQGYVAEIEHLEKPILKEYIKEKGTSVFNVAKSSGFPKYNTNFKNAFDEGPDNCLIGMVTFQTDSPTSCGIVEVDKFSVVKSFFEKHVNIVSYDKYKNLDTKEDLLKSDILFLCLPTLFNEHKGEYDKNNYGDYSGIVHDSVFINEKEWRR